MTSVDRNVAARPTSFVKINAETYTTAGIASGEQVASRNLLATDKATDLRPVDQPAIPDNHRPDLHETPASILGELAKDPKEQDIRLSAKASVQFTALDVGHGVPSNLASDSSATEDLGTAVSSLDGKPPSIGAKSIASAATFALDEKESLRPDDSASIAAAAEDEDLQRGGLELMESSNVSDDGVRAFREQLNEISAIDPLHRTTLAGVHQNGVPAEGVLYVTLSDTGNLPLQILPHQIIGEPYVPLPDMKLLEALDNPRDRIWVLKLEQDVIDFVKDAKETSLVLPQCNSFYRMLAHKIADYYVLGHSVDDSNSAVRLFKTPACRIPRPLTGVVTPSTAASTPPPSLQMKILRRGVDVSGPAIANGSNMPSKSTSETGESEDDPRKPVSREEREARYEAARLRIMGSAKPVETAEIKQDESRSSSVSGKRGRRSNRNDSDDDFEARSAYNSYFTPSLAQNGYQPQQAIPQGQFQAYPPAAAYPQYPGQSATGQYWYYPTPDSEPAWAPNSQQNYDLTREFDRAMSFQQAQPPTYSAPQSPYGQTAFQQSYPSTYGWSQSTPPLNGQPPQQFLTHNDRPSSSASQSQQAYAYGQLPSQALGRPPNALEHPLPGSYKSRHFDPQSQSFVPGHGNNTVFRPFLPQRTMSGPEISPAGPPVPISIERQMSSQPQASQLGSPGHAQHGGHLSRMAPQSMTHPLPQPVFPTQTMPNVSLPPRPSASQVPFDASKSINAMAAQNESTIAKWGTPASLPAKPPPSADNPEATRFISPQRSTQQGYNMPSFGSMPAGGSV